MWPSRPRTRGDEYLMLMVCPFAMADTCSGGLSGAFFFICAEAENVEAVTRAARPNDNSKRFITGFSF